MYNYKILLAFLVSTIPMAATQETKNAESTRGQTWPFTLKIFPVSRQISVQLDRNATIEWDGAFEDTITFYSSRRLFEGCIKEFEEYGNGTPYSDEAKEAWCHDMQRIRQLAIAPYCFIFIGRNLNGTFSYKILGTVKKIEGEEEVKRHLNKYMNANEIAELITRAHIILNGVADRTPKKPVSD